MPPCRSPRAALFSIIFLCSFLGVTHDQVQMLARQVNGMLNGAVFLPIGNISTSETVKRIDWDFQPQHGTLLNIAEFQGGALERPNPNDRFGSRLELANETTLMIQNLEKEDSGVYKARVKLSSAKVQEHSFQLEVYDPVPGPRILHQRVSSSSVGCNVTLECLLSEKAGLAVSWRIGDEDLRTSEGSSDRYRLSSDGWRLHVSVRSNATDSNFTCLVSNPADRKHASIDLLSICRPEDDGPMRNRWFLSLSITVLAVILAIFATICIWKKGRKCSASKAEPAMPRETIPEPLYYENQSERNPPEMDHYQVAGGCSQKSLMGTASTLYAVVQPRPIAPNGPLKSDEVGNEGSEEMASFASENAKLGKL